MIKRIKIIKGLNLINLRNLCNLCNLINLINLSAKHDVEKKQSLKILDKTMKKQNLIELAVKMIVAALTAFLTAITTTSCMGHGPL